MLNSYELVVFIGAKGAGSGEGEVKGESEVITVGAFLLSPVFLMCWPLVSSLPVMSFHMVKMPGE